MVVSAAGDVFVGGQTYGSLDRRIQGKGDAFVRSYTSAGVLRWAHQYGNRQDEHVSALVIAPGGRLFVVDSTNGELKAARGTGLTFIKCLSLGGKVRWTRQDLGPARGAAWSPTLGLLVSGKEWLPDAPTAGSAATRGAVAGRHPRITDLHSEAYLRAYSINGGSAWMRRVDSGGSDVFEGVAGGPGVAANVVGSVEGPVADQPWAGGSDLVVRLYR